MTAQETAQQAQSQAGLTPTELRIVPAIILTMASFAAPVCSRSFTRSLEAVHDKKRGDPSG